MKKTYTAEEVTNIENQAYETGLAVGKYSEQKKLIDLIESMNTSPATVSLGSLVWTKHLIDKIEGNA
jgi:arabinogalactan endo-1,4-beta-galactosidase